jgi:hypothetical protein
MLSGRLQGFIPPKWAHFQDHFLTLHTVCVLQVTGQCNYIKEHRGECKENFNNAKVTESVRKMTDGRAITINYTIG